LICANRGYPVEGVKGPKAGRAPPWVYKRKLSVKKSDCLPTHKKQTEHEGRKKAYRCSALEKQTCCGHLLEETDSLVQPRWREAVFGWVL